MQVLLKYECFLIHFRKRHFLIFFSSFLTFSRIVIIITFFNDFRELIFGFLQSALFSPPKSAFIILAAERIANARFDTFFVFFLCVRFRFDRAFDPNRPRKSCRSGSSAVTLCTRQNEAKTGPDFEVSRLIAQVFHKFAKIAKCIIEDS